MGSAPQIPVETLEDLDDFVSEVQILSRIDHPGIVALLGAYYHARSLWIVLELCEAGALDSIMHDSIKAVRFHSRALVPFHIENPGEA